MAHFDENDLMQGVYDKLLADGACKEALVVILENKDQTVKEFFTDGEGHYIGLSLFHTPHWAYWLAIKYYNKDIFPRDIIWKCIRASIDPDASISTGRALHLYRRVENHLNKKQKNILLKSLEGSRHHPKKAARKK